jgi:hypothetical protein
VPSLPSASAYDQLSVGFLLRCGPLTKVFRRPVDSEKGHSKRFGTEEKAGQQSCSAHHECLPVVIHNSLLLSFLSGLNRICASNLGLLARAFKHRSPSVHIVTKSGLSWGIHIFSPRMKTRIECKSYAWSANRMLGLSRVDLTNEFQRLLYCRCDLLDLTRRSGQTVCPDKAFN